MIKNISINGVMDIYSLQPLVNGLIVPLRLINCHF